jgi:hypothetical protein
MTNTYIVREMKHPRESGNSNQHGNGRDNALAADKLFRLVEAIVWYHKTNDLISKPFPSYAQ